MGAFQSRHPMKNAPRLALLLATVALLGDLTLRELPEKLLADLAHGHARPAAALALVAATPASPARHLTLAATALAPEQIAAAGRIVTFSTQNFRARFASN